MNALIVLTTLLTVALALPLSELDEQQWQQFKIDYGKSYKNAEEESMRKEIFAKKLRKFEEHNKKYEEGLISYQIGITRFADITHEEYKEMFPPMNISAVPRGLPFVPPLCLKAPTSIDWREKGAVTPVKDQGKCRSCYAFSATGALEGQLFRKTGKLVHLSDQNLVDCTFNYDNIGCGGGWPHNCFRYIKENGGIDTASSYPYEGKDGQCRYNSQDSAGKFNNFVTLPAGDENTLLTAVATIGPISICLNGDAFYDYRKGVIIQPCKTDDITHCVVIVGYGTSRNGEDYWLIKNSWGERFGENGYAKIIRNKNLCQVASHASYPVA